MGNLEVKRGGNLRLKQVKIADALRSAATDLKLLADSLDCHQTPESVLEIASQLRALLVGAREDVVKLRDFALDEISKRR